MFIHSILFYLSWPVLILVCYGFISLARKNFEQRWDSTEDRE